MEQDAQILDEKLYILSSARQDAHLGTPASPKKALLIQKVANIHIKLLSLQYEHMPKVGEWDTTANEQRYRQLEEEAERLDEKLRLLWSAR